MTSQPYRTPQGGRIDRSRTLHFSFDGRHMTGHPGDTLASALLANGVHLVGRSFKYHRPRGIVTAGSDEPNALVTLGEGRRAEPNTRATMVELFDGLVARSQNAWPSLGFDIGAVNSLLSPFIPAGFYYKTFMGGPKGAWTRLYEPLIRRAAGLGPAPTETDPDLYDKRHAHCDVLVVGAGPAGLAAARAAANGGARVVLIDERASVGGSLHAIDTVIDGRDPIEWAEAAAAEFAAQPEARLLLRTTAFGRYDHNLVMAVERLADHDPAATGPRQRLWQIRARHVILATGAHEQPLLFGNNDLPGVMLASAGVHYARHHAVLAGQRIVVGTNTASGAGAARLMTAAGAEIVAVADARQGEAIVRAIGGKRVRAVEIASASGSMRRVDCDAVLMSGGWQPALHLHSHSGGKARFDEALGCFVPANVLAGVTSVGACAGQFALATCLVDGHRAGAEAALAVGLPGSLEAPETDVSTLVSGGDALFRAPPAKKSFVDFQNDVTTADIALAHREGFVSVEHLKRYTTTGMATDQGKLSNLNALSLMAGHLGKTPGQVGTTTFRPPYTPVAFGALAGIDRGDLMDPIRVTPMHDWHAAQGCPFENVGQWKRPWYFPKPGEDMEAAVRRECAAVRASVGLFDASTLGKIDIRGPDAAAFLNLVYTNAWLKLDVGRCRYGLMCGEDGMLIDDGVTTRTGPDRFLMTTTTGNAARVMDHLEDLLQTEWPHLQVYLTSVTDHWAASVVTGPRARDVLASVAEDVDLSNEAFPHLSMREGRVAGIPARVYRISFTGELSYEVHVAAHHGLAAWEALYAAGRPFGITPYGTEAMHVLRADKGFIIVGQETDGTVTPDDLGLAGMIGKAKRDFVGKRSLARPDLVKAGRAQLVGLEISGGASSRADVLEEGAQITASASPATGTAALGHVTSAYWSEAVGRPIALAMVADGRARMGQTLHVPMPGRPIAVTVVSPVFYDPRGARLDG